VGFARPGPGRLPSALKAGVHSADPTAMKRPFVMTPHRRRPSARRGTPLLAALLAGSAALAAAAPPAASVTPPTQAIYSCVDDRGRRLTSDRPIVECQGMEQRILNRDGSLRAVLPPVLTPEERARKEARERREAEQRAAQADAVRRDRTRMARFPDEAAHARAREAALDPVRSAMRESALRMTALDKERKPLLAETEFYVGRALPISLQSKLDANEASMTAQRSAMQTQEAELERINRLYDAELQRLRQLWAGAQPGSLGPMASAAASEPAKP
jgi:hypothetical protein